jgi:APA family basic amino acid/polyamine antiporter
MKKKLNALSLSGLMVGPVLGSGIVVLPSLAYEALRGYAMFAWVLVMLLGAGFAYVFTRMSMMVNTNEGVSRLIGEALGARFRELSANYLTAAVCFGPVAVIKTASGFVQGMLPAGTLPPLAVCFLFMAVTVMLLMCGIRLMGNVMLALSTLTACVLTAGGIYSLFVNGPTALPAGLPDIRTLGSTLLILFWAIIGWEVIGNYVEDVQNPRRTLIRAMRGSVIVVILVYFVVTYALQSSPLAKDGAAVSLNAVMLPLFGAAAPYLLGAVALALCYCTILMVMGAVTRQMAARSEEGRFPAVFRQKPGSRAPVKAIALLSLVHCVLIVLVETNIVSLAFVVGIANTFFIGNALLGLLGAFKCMKSLWLRGVILLLTLCLASLLLFSPAVGWILLALITAWTVGTVPRMNGRNAGAQGEAPVQKA